MDTQNPNQPTSTSAMAIAGLVIGLVALLTSFLPFINNISFVLGLLALIFSIIGLVACLRGKKKGKGLAIAAIIVAVVSCAVVLGTQAMFSAAIDEATSTTKASLSTTKAASSATSTAKAASDESASGDDDATSSPTAESATPAATDETSSTETSAPANASEEYAYQVSIDDCEVGETYDGNPCAIITYTFTNNSDKATSFLVAISDKAYQNGVELSSGTVSGLDSFVTAGKEIKPGATITLQQAYVLDDQSDVTVECTEWLAFDDVILAEATFPVA